MPIYEYKCSKCGNFEAIQSFSDKPLKCKPDCTEKNCPKNAERLISAAAFHLKGSGWYKTDYAGGSGSSSGSSSSSSTDSSTSADTSTASSDAKSDEGKKKKDKKGDSLKQAKGGCGKGCGCH